MKVIIFIFNILTHRNLDPDCFYSCYSEQKLLTIRYSKCFKLFILSFNKISRVRKISLTRILGLWTQVLDAGLWMLDCGHYTFDTGLWTLDTVVG